MAQAPTPTRWQTVSDSDADSDADSNSKNQPEPNLNRHTIVIINNANNYIDFIQGRCRLSERFVQRFSFGFGFALIAAAAGVGKNQQTSHLPLEFRVLTNLMVYFLGVFFCVSFILKCSLLFLYFCFFFFLANLSACCICLAVVGFLINLTPASAWHWIYGVLKSPTCKCGMNYG